MSDAEAPNAETPPVARIRRRRLSLAWLIPLAAVAALGALVYLNLAAERGPVIAITFTRAEGLEPGAEIVHRGIAVGVVRDVELTPDLSAVRVRAELNPDAAALAREGSRFWVVRPELSLTRVSGLETILGPRYIAVRPGPAEAPVARRFEGLEAPTVPDDPSTDALTLRLTAERRGSLAPGSPVLYRDIRVGDVREIRLAGDATHVEVRVSIEPRYAPLVRDDSRFWIQSGVGVDWGLFSGLSLRADSLDALLRPGVAFATPSRPGDRVGDDHAFALESEPDEDWLDWRPSIPLDATP